MLESVNSTKIVGRLTCTANMVCMSYLFFKKLLHSSRLVAQLLSRLTKLRKFDVCDKIYLFWSDIWYTCFWSLKRNQWYYFTFFCCISCIHTVLHQFDMPIEKYLYKKICFSTLKAKSKEIIFCIQKLSFQAPIQTALPFWSTRMNFIVHVSMTLKRRM